MISKMLRFALLLLVMGTITASCAAVARQRTLPPSIRTIAMPMFVNRSPEPGIEEFATIYTQEEFLADGRLDLVRQGEADAVVEVTITGFSRSESSLDSDNFADTLNYIMEARVRVWRNVPGKPLIGKERLVTATSWKQSDARNTAFEPEPLSRERALRTLARRIVSETLTGKVD